jgi:hypothetical protein
VGEFSVDDDVAENVGSVSGGAGAVSVVLWWQAERDEYYSRVWVSRFHSLGCFYTT